MNYVSLSGGAQWQSKTRIGSVQFKVTGESGVTTLTNEDFLVSLADGSGSYKCEANILTVILSTDCTVKFETNGGSKIDPVIAIYGELLNRPEDPVRDGKYLVGWFKDIHLTEEWNFETDTVKGNMTLYAKWANISEDVPTDTPNTEQTTEDEAADEQLCILCGKRPTYINQIPLCWLSLLIFGVSAIILSSVVRKLIQKGKKKKKGKKE